MNPANQMGVIYVASGKRYVDEAANSANSLKKEMPGIPVHLHSDLSNVPNVFDRNFRLTECRYNCYDKVPPLLNSPFRKTLFLDTDTYVSGSLEEIDILLDRYDLLVCHTAFRDPNPIAEIPSSFTEFNTGMIAFRKNEKTDAFLRKWLENYEMMGHKADQPAFRKTLWEDDQIRTYILPPEYNFRTIFPGFIGGGSEVKIIHGRHNDWKWIQQRLNRSKEPRVVLLSPLHRIGRQVIVIRKWSDLFKSFVKRIYRK